MAQASTTVIDLARLSLPSGGGKRLDVPVRLEPLEMAGQIYAPTPESPQVRLDLSRPAGGYAFRLRFPVHIKGPCMRCLGPAAIDLEIDSREVDQNDTEDEELRSPYVIDDELNIGRWAHDAAVLAIPTQFLCRSDCAGLCPVCGESLNDADPADHKHDSGSDPRWAKLKDLKLE
jgi:uncharacterized protein